ncbi:carboxy-terminal domain RNA polymerase II polypeptide A small phosphatase 1-like [Neltuma alba]|uniref:carboxy-terminal domain RNA polymerase II polypeptide A small phosphatase 1-like n=1 Tax=Neltuma alba TaxID=207710 RepID=UPI0010A31B6F|nr:carboxy-terminal domain RNA polymerase II polypeptide A small phosphatase 1-like [Prosopis alba]
MVSRRKRTPVKSIKDSRNGRRRRQKSPVKHVVAPFSVLASIRRRLSKFFSRFTRTGTPNSHKGYTKLKKMHSKEQHCEESLNDIRKTLVFNNPLPPLISSDKRTIFLDLDETLIHSKTDPPPERFDFVVRPRIDGVMMNFYVLKRPGVDEFLEYLAAKFEVVVFTAALREYASMVLDRLDRNGLISHRLYRDSCKQVEGKFVKDLSEMGRDLKRVVIVDDNPNSYENQPDNAIPIPPFVDDLRDQELQKLTRFFQVSDYYDDMRTAVKYYLADEECALDY